jgi:flagellar biosynthetic protein FlhB
MADEEKSPDDKTEEATPERRDDFREKGQIATSHELSQVIALAAIVAAFGWYGPVVLDRISRMLIKTFESVPTLRIDQTNLFPFLSSIWIEMIWIIAPLFIIAGIIGGVGTLLQTQFNWSWEKLQFNWKVLNPFPGIAKMFKTEAVVGAIKSSAKLFVVSVVAWMILRGEWDKVPYLLNVPVFKTWIYWGNITTQLIWGVVGLMLFVAAGDYIYSFNTMETKMRMTKQEVKDEVKQRETDPHVKARIRRMAREIAGRKTIENTKKATVVITNPTHYSIAVRYEVGMVVPIVVAKGVDFLALKMRETAKEMDIPIVENKPLARALYAAVDEGEEIPGEMYKAVAEVIKFVFKLKGMKIPGQKSKDEKISSNEVLQ